MKQDLKDSTRLVWYSSLVFCLLLGAGAVVTVIYWNVLPWQVSREREVFQNSQQYVDAKKTLLLKLAEEYDAADTDVAKYRAADPVKFKDVISGLETQQESIKARIKTEASMIPGDQVPETCRRFLR